MNVVAREKLTAGRTRINWRRPAHLGIRASFSSTVILPTENKHPEQIARDRIDARLTASGWTVQDKTGIDFPAASGVAITEYGTSAGPADCVLFSNRKALGVVEAKEDAWGAKITTVEAQSSGYAEAGLTGRYPRRGRRQP